VLPRPSCPAFGKKREEKKVKRLIGCFFLIMCTCAVFAFAQNKPTSIAQSGKAVTGSAKKSVLLEIDKIVPVHGPINPAALFEVQHKVIIKEHVGQLVAWEGTVTEKTAVLIKETDKDKYFAAFENDCKPPVSLTQGTRVKIHGRLKQICTILLQINKGSITGRNYYLWLDDGSTATVIP
jgi:hypothetical protein